MSATGVINLYKPRWISSARYVYRLRRLVGVRRVGHAGTLDPFADGVLLACVGPATRLTERLMGLTKTYEVGLRLGVTNASFDPEQPFESLPVASPPTEDAVRAALPDFIGTVMQSPPAFSAMKVGGSRGYDRARAGVTLELPPRPVRIDRIELMSYEWPEVRLQVTCGRGTYIRALARDLGLRWRCGAVCVSLRRTRVGPFGIEDALDLGSADAALIRQALRSIEEVEPLLQSPSS